MIRTEADELVAFVDTTWKMGFSEDDFGHERWLEFMLGQEDSTVVMLALQKLSQRQRQRVTIADVRAALAREAGPEGETEADEFARETPGWVKIWLVARANDDTRVLIEQRPGYDFLQLQNPHHRTYVWPEQELMPDNDRLAYATTASKLGSKLHTVFSQAMGS